MTSRLARRRFLAQTGSLLAGAAFVDPWCRPLAAAEDRSAWRVTCRDSILRQTGQADCWSALQKIGAEGVEVQIAADLSLPGLFHPSAKYTAAGAASIERVAADAKAAGQRITAFCMYNRFEERSAAEIVSCREAALAAKSLGVPAIRIDVVPHKMPRADFLVLAITTLRKVMAETESTGVKFAIENHGNMTNDPEFLTALFDGVGSKRLGLTLDTGNFYWYGHPLSKVYETFTRFADRVFHTHCKSIRYPEDQREKRRPMGWKYDEYQKPIDEGDIDFTQVVKILQKAGYSNDLCVEDESLGGRSAADISATLAREIVLLKQVRGQLAL